MSFQAYLDNIEDKTGLTPRQFIDLAHAKGLDDPGVKATAIIDWLKADYNLGRGHAMALVHVIKNGPRIDAKHVDSGGTHSPSDICGSRARRRIPTRASEDALAPAPTPTRARRDARRLLIG